MGKAHIQSYSTTSIKVLIISIHIEAQKILNIYNKDNIIKRVIFGIMALALSHQPNMEKAKADLIKGKGIKSCAFATTLKEHTHLLS